MEDLLKWIAKMLRLVIGLVVEIKIRDSIEVIESENTTFKALDLKEKDIEEFLRKNIGLILEGKNFLIVGQQVTNKENGRSDLTAVDENGNLVLIEIKRDLGDIKSRKEPFEFQAIRYAASYAMIKTANELVEKVFVSYIEKHRKEFELGELTVYEKAMRILNEFLEKNNAIKTFNNKQRIILIASKFDLQILSAVAWLIANGVDISCFELSPFKTGEGIFINIEKVLPPERLENYYVEIEDKRKASTEGNNGEITRTYLPRMNQLFEWGLVKKGDPVVIKNFEESSEAIVQDEKSVVYQGENLTFNQWGQKVTGWSAVGIYEWTMLKGDSKTLDQLRKEKLKELELSEVSQG